MKITLDIEDEDIERITRSLDNQYAYTVSRSLEDSRYKRLADLFRGLMKRGPGQAAYLCDSTEISLPKVKKKSVMRTIPSDPTRKEG